MHAHHQRHFDAQLPGGIHHPLGQHITTHDTAENIDQHALDALIGEQDAEGVGDLRLICAAADIEEVSRLAAINFDDVHGRHRQAGAIHHTCDVTAEGNIRQIELARLHFARILFIGIAQSEDIFLAKEGVAVEVHFCIEGQHLSLLGENQRIDLSQRCVALVIGAIEPLHRGDEFTREFGWNTQSRGDAAALKRRQTDHRVDGLLENFFRMFLGDLFDLNAALGRANDAHPRLRAIEHHGEIELAGDIEPLLDQHSAHQTAFRTGLMRHQILAQHVTGACGGFVRGFDDLDAAALTPAAGVNLRFDYTDAAAEILGGLLRLCRRRGNDAARHDYAETFEDFLGLKFVNIHSLTAR